MRLMNRLRRALGRKPIIEIRAGDDIARKMAMAPRPCVFQFGPGEFSHERVRDALTFRSGDVVRGASSGGATIFKGSRLVA